MAVVVADVTNRAKEFASLTSAEIERASDDAELQINATAWGTKANLATIYLAAHFLSAWNPDLAIAAGAVSSETVGEVSRTYAVGSAPAAGDYGSSRWGVEYKRLMRTIPLWFPT